MSSYRRPYLPGFFIRRGVALVDAWAVRLGFDG